MSLVGCVICRIPVSSSPAIRGQIECDGGQNGICPVESFIYKRTGSSLTKDIIIRYLFLFFENYMGDIRKPQEAQDGEFISIFSNSELSSLVFMTL